MRTVISHFFNEEYLLPWWLKHHRELFDHGVMINHGSNDRSVDIIRALAPSWKVVNSTLLEFDAFLTDFEVMQYERGLPGWKIALNVTEFIMPTMPLATLEATLSQMGRTGCALSGNFMVEQTPNSDLNIDIPLPLQCYYGIDDNIVSDPTTRVEMGLGPIAYKNRFYHCNEVGMYQPGRHFSYHPDSTFRIQDVMIFNYSFAPWNEAMKRRKLQIKSKLDTSKNLWANQDLIDSICRVAEERRHGRSIPGTF